jgi:aspartyl-tRNA synthetase
MPAAGAAAVQTTADGRRRGKVFQIAKSFSRRRFARGPATEFTQIDIEASLFSRRHFQLSTEGMLAAIFKAARNIEIKIPFDRLTYREAVDRYGSDKPDRRLVWSLSISEKFFGRAGLRFFAMRWMQAAL